MRAITTYDLPYTSTLPTRIVARVKGTGHGIILSIHAIPDQFSSSEDRHGYVASQLAHKLGWYTATNYLIGGSTGENSWAFVFSDSRVIATKDRHEEKL